jgi:phosphonatase-like hydrolase
MKTKLVVFDIAGTTVRDKGNVANTFLAAFIKHGLEVSREDANWVMGYRKMEAIRMLLDKLYPEMQNKDGMVKAIHDSFEEIMLEFYMSDKDLAPFPQSEEVFRWLHANGVKVALNTGFTRFVTEGILYRLGWKDNAMIDAVICSDEVPEGRPSPFMIRELMHKFNLSDPADVVKVGDTEVDVLEGRNAGCGKVISVTTGAYSRADLESYGPDAVLDGLSELNQHID